MKKDKTYLLNITPSDDTLVQLPDATNIRSSHREIIPLSNKPASTAKPEKCSTAPQKIVVDIAWTISRQ